MEINEELIAAYIDGDVTEGVREQVRDYLAQHPAELDLAFSLMEGTNAIDESCQEPELEHLPAISGQLFSGIACCAMAAFAPRTKTSASNVDVRNNIGQRRERMAAFLEELDEED